MKKKKDDNWYYTTIKYNCDNSLDLRPSIQPQNLSKNHSNLSNLRNLSNLNNLSNNFSLNQNDPEFQKSSKEKPAANVNGNQNGNQNVSSSQLQKQTTNTAIAHRQSQQQLQQSQQSQQQLPFFDQLHVSVNTRNLDPTNQSPSMSPPPSAAASPNTTTIPGVVPNNIIPKPVPSNQLAPQYGNLQQQNLQQKMPPVSVSNNVLQPQIQIQQRQPSPRVQQPQIKIQQQQQQPAPVPQLLRQQVQQQPPVPTVPNTVTSGNSTVPLTNSTVQEGVQQQVPGSRQKLKQQQQNHLNQQPPGANNGFGHI